MSTFELAILLPTHKEALLSYARNRLASRISDETERELSSWTARWRGESLDHYLPQGWSFGAFTDATHVSLKGFILAQPYLFHRGHTQTLWVEALEADDQVVARALLETVYRWARDKHFQCLLSDNSPEIGLALSDGGPVAQTVGQGQIEIRTAKF